MMLLGTIGLATACSSSEKTKDKIVFGQAISVTGAFAQTTAAATNVYDMWIEEVNAAGGLYLKGYDKSLPIELIRYDDGSDVNATVALLEKLIVEDKVDLLLPPGNTDMLYNAAPVANNHGYILLGGPGGALKLKEIIAGLPYFFSVLNFADTQVPVLADILTEIGVQKVAMVYVQELMGIEYSNVAIPDFALKGIDVVMVKNIPIGTTDFSALFAEAATNQVDAFVAFTYPNESFAMVGQAQASHTNFKALFAAVGMANPVPCRDTPKFGGAIGIEGIMGAGAWNPKTSAGAKAFDDKYMARWGASPAYWGPLMYYSGMQFMQQAIEQAGSLDQAKIREIMATTTFDTSMGPMYFTGGFNQTHPGEIGQWQSGVFEVIDPGVKRTAAPIYPKPSW